MFGNFFETVTNSSKLITPSPFLSACDIIVSAFRLTSASLLAIWFDLRIFTNSDLVMTPLLSSSNNKKANFNLVYVVK
jgi:hypothetical protein